jgi:hemoglobin/transferrin/lactoferrin receptor protein
MKGKLFCLVMLCCTNIAAQDDPDSLYMSPGNFLLDEMIISANRWEQNIREVPGRVAKISSALIQLQNPQTAADMLGASNQVFIQKSQLGGGSPMIRGFSTNRVLLVIDGVRMNNAIFRSGNVQNVISLDANAIRQAEILFGPGSVMYGSDAIGGVMDFHTLVPQFSKDDKLHITGKALARHATANRERTGHVDFTLGLKKWSFVTSITRALYDDLRMGKHGPQAYTRPDYVLRRDNTDVLLSNENINVQVPSGYDQWNTMHKLAFRPNENFDVTYTYHYSKTSEYARYDRLILRNQNGLANAEWYYGPQQWQMHALHATTDHLLPVMDQLRLTAAYQDYGESRHNRSFGNSNRTNRFERVKAFSINLDMDKEINDQMTIFYGAEWVMNKVYSTAYRENINTGAVTGTSTRYPDNSDWRSMAAYVNMKMRLNEQWLLNASARLSNVYTFAAFDKTYFNFPFDEASLNNTAVNGSVGIVYNPLSNWKFFTNLSNGFRAPNVDDIGKVFDSQPGIVVVPNPGLKPETAYSAEAGMAGVVSKTIKLDLTGYYTLLDNAIVRAPASFNDQTEIDFDGVPSRVLALQNISKVTVYGAQAGIDVQLLKSTRLTSNINYQKGKERDPETGNVFPPTHVAPLFGATHVIVKYKQLTGDLYSNYNGEIAYRNLALTERADEHLYARDENGNPYAPAWWTLNLKTSWRVNKHIAIDAGLENILDKRYRPYASGISAPGRNFIVSLRASL